MAHLSSAQVETYKETGLLNGIDVIRGDDVARVRGCFDELEAKEGREKSQVGLFDRHSDQPFIWEIATHPKILDCVTSLIGKDILLLSTHIFCKYGPNTKFVAWHQDLQLLGNRAAG